LHTITDLARANGAAVDPTCDRRLADAWITLRIMRFHALRTLPCSSTGGRPATAIHKLLWPPVSPELGELAIDVPARRARPR
jgi:hypothetical protein